MAVTPLRSIQIGTTSGNQPFSLQGSSPTLTPTPRTTIPTPTTPTPVTISSTSKPASPVAPPPIQTTPAAPTPPINATTRNPALTALFNQANSLIADFQAKGGTLKPELQSEINRINSLEGEKVLAVAGARTSADKKDAFTLENYIKRADEAQTKQQETIDGLLKELKTAREGFISSLAPTPKETELRRSLNTLRTDRQLLPLELRKEGISATGIEGRQFEDERVRKIQEQNLLLELGLEQEARQFATTAKEKQIGFITEDANLQLKIQDKLFEQEKSVLERARTLQKDSILALKDITSTFTGLSFDDMDTETQEQLIELARVNGIPFGLLRDALATAKKQQIFENSIKSSNAAKGRDGSGDGVTGSTEAQLYAGLSTKTATAVRSKVGAWKTEPLVQNFAVVQEGKNTVDSVQNNTTNPADDQLLIYSLAKVLDPGSVVREGEYATAQKYAQSWVKAYGKSVTQAIAGTGFLSEEARQNIKNTINTKYQSSKKTYDNLQKQYTQGINSLTGRTDGDRFLTDYAIPVVGILPEATTNEEKSAALDQVLASSSGTASEPEKKGGWVSRFLGVFGIGK